MKSKPAILKIIKYLTPIVIALFLNSCSWLFLDRHQVFNDEFRKSSKAITRMDLRPLERRTEIGNAYIIFEKEISPSTNDVKAYCVVSRSDESFAPETMGFLKIDDASYEIKLQSIVSEQKMKTETSSSVYTVSDSTGVKSGSTVDSDTQIWIDDKFVIIPGMELVEKILNSRTLLIRFYFGPVPATYKVINQDLYLLKKTLSL